VNRKRFSYEKKKAQTPSKERSNNKRNEKKDFFS
jgi:hypothetical protein